MHYSIAIVGGGFAAGTLLRRICTQLLMQDAPAPLRIALFEPSGNLFTGIAYGANSSAFSLTITPLKDFLPEGEMEPFLEWFCHHRNLWMARLQSHSGAHYWLKELAKAEAENAYEGLYIPRFVYGLFVQHRLEILLAQTRRHCGFQLDVIDHAAHAIQKHEEGFTLQYLNGCGLPASLTAAKVVVATGSPSVKPIFKTHGPAWLDNPFQNGMHHGLVKLFDTLRATKQVSERNVVVVGSNASALEMVYLLQCHFEGSNLLNRIYLVSESGQLPKRIRMAEVEARFVHLDGLDAEPVVEAYMLMVAIHKDIALLAVEGIHVGMMYAQLVQALVRQLKRLSRSERKKFHHTMGMHFSKLIRRAGTTYSDAFNQWVTQGRLVLVRGRFQQLQPQNGTHHFVAQHTQQHSSEYQVVGGINCSGFELPAQWKQPFFSTLLQAQLARINESGLGLWVDEHLQASEGIYVLGPMLSGIFNKTAEYWHMESARRIVELSSPLCTHLLQTVQAHSAPAIPQTEAVYELAQA